MKRYLKIYKFIWAIVFLFCIKSNLSAQYVVSGGTKTPLLVIDNRIAKFQVYLVYGIESVSISYNSSSSAHQWYRYQSKALENERVTSTQQGETSTIRNLSEGYGYFVMEGDSYSTANFVWLIDYSKYPIDIQNLYVMTGTSAPSPCVSFRLGGTNLTPSMYYNTPDGIRTLLERRFEVSYGTLEWIEESKQFLEVLRIDTADNSNLLDRTFTAPLRDTKVDVTGDLFARHFEVEQMISTEIYTASALSVHFEQQILSENQEEGEEIQSPVDMRFTAYANEPVADFYEWKIIKDGDTLFTRLGSEIDFTFQLSGQYTVTGVVYDRSRVCSSEPYEYTFFVTETQILIPNAFSPEGSPGINDEFRIGYKSILSFRAWIFNRWGQELFQWSDPTKGWDGKYRGRYVPSGAYYYVIEYTGTDGRKRKKTGDINVIRSTATEIIIEQ
ncbi:MAG: gliding motility-associated C-terminal domain-containing protein [Tannerella sp.]|jgi:gliding motility-associated-like protein|nr:gliding motility-associated C-terminal domain-containing protein [Tannerella sp.]